MKKRRMWMGMVVGWVSVGGTGCAPDDAQTVSQPRAAGEHIWPSFPEESADAGDKQRENPWLDGSLVPPDAGKGAGRGGAEGTDHGDSADEAETASADGSDPKGRTEPGQDSPPEEDPVLLQRRFTLYAEGLGSDKRLIIWGEAGPSEVDCHVEIYTNGSTEPRSKLILPAGFPESNTIAFCSPAAWNGSCSHQMSGSLYNGNDALVLRCGDVVMDSLGTVGEDPGDGWIRREAEWSISTQNQVLVRCGEEADPDPLDATTLLDWVPQGADESLEETLSRCPSPKTGMGGASSSTHS